MKLLARTEKGWIRSAVVPGKDEGTFRVVGNMVLRGKARDLKKGFTTINHICWNSLLPEALVGFLLRYEADKGFKNLYVALPENDEGTVVEEDDAITVEEAMAEAV